MKMTKEEFFLINRDAVLSFEAVQDEEQLEHLYKKISNEMTAKGFRDSIESILKDPKAFVGNGKMPSLQVILKHCPKSELFENKIKAYETKAIMEAKAVFFKFENYLNSNYGLTREQMREKMPVMKSKTLNFIKEYFGGVEQMFDWLDDYMNYSFSRMKEIESKFVFFWAEESKKEFQQRLNLPKISTEKNLLLQ